MSKIKVRLSDSKQITLNFDRTVLKFWPFWLIDSAQIVTFLLLSMMFIREVSVDIYDPVRALKWFVLTLTVIAGLQALKVVLGGGRFFPESKFDLLYLILAIGLISTLLVKQMFDLPGGKGMLPSTNYWFLTILGFLTFMLFSYLIDIVFRKKSGYKHILYPLLVIVDLVFIYKFLVDGSVNRESEQLMLVLLPVFFVLPFITKSYKASAMFAINFGLVLILTIKDLNESILVLSLIIIAIQEVVLVVTKQLKWSEVKNEFKAIRKGKINLLKSSFLFYNFGLILLSLFGVIGLIVKAIVDGLDFFIIKDGLDGNWNTIKAIDEMDKFLIGGGFIPYNNSFVANYFENYGLLGLILLVSMIGWILYYLNKFAFSIKSGDKRKLVLTSFAFTLLNIVVLGVITDIVSSVLFFSAVIAAIVANMAAIEDGWIIKREYIKLPKFKSQRMRYIAKGVQALSAVGIVVLVVLMFVKFEDIFILS